MSNEQPSASEPVYDDFEKYRIAQVETFQVLEGSIPQWNDGQVRFVKEWMSKYPRDSRILDVGCGDGVGLAALGRLGFRSVSGVDFSPAKAANARRSGFPVHETDMHDLHHIGTGEIDVVYASHSLEHALDPRKVLKEFHRVLRARGELVLVLPYPDTGETLKHCGQFMLGTNLKDDAGTLMSFLERHGFLIMEKVYDQFREPEIWLRANKWRT